MSEDEPEYRVGKGKPPLDTRFRKGQSGNPAGARLHRRRDGRLVALIAAALGGKAPGHRRRTQRQAIIEGLVEQAARGDLRATKLLFDLVLRTELAAPPADPGEEDPRAFLIRELDRLAAAQEGEAGE